MRRHWAFLSVVMLLVFALPLSAQSVPEIGYDSAPNLLKIPVNVNSIWWRFAIRGHRIALDVDALKEKDLFRSA
jgi:hypothetical protein